MKRLFVISMMLVASVVFVKAQPGGGGFNMSAEDMAKRMDDNLAEVCKGLTADQKAKLKVVNLDLAKQQAEVMQKNQGNREAMMAANQKIESTRETKYKEILTAAQLKQYNDWRAQQPQRGGGGGGGQRNN